MPRFLLRRAINYVVLCLIAVFLTFTLASLTFDPIGVLRHRQPPPPAATLADKIDQLHLDQPIPQRFLTWLAGIPHGNFGVSVAGDPIGPDVLPRAMISLRLFLAGTIIGVLLAVIVGVAGAVRQYRFTDYATAIGSYILIAAPVFVIGGLLKYGAVQVNLATGSDFLQTDLEVTPGFSGGLGAELVDRFRHLILPTLAIALPMAAQYSRYQRNAMLDVLGADFLRTARAKGLRRGKVLVRHGLRTALIPMSTLFAWAFGTMLVGGPFTEHIFDWHGMGAWLIDGIDTQDANVTTTVTLFVAGCVLASGLLADLAYAALDPRVRI
ncbi:MAG TPA: ABC transporter permease [Pseudonocardiaceae bacterium]|nr:ABC transporter permease [Pseudonocardiaceae bacterium]